MKKISVIMLSFSLVTVVAQKKNVSSALKKIESGKLNEAYELLSPARENPESQDLPKTWFAYGRLWEETEIRQDAAMLAKTANPFEDAYANYTKARNLDSKGELKNDINTRLYKMYNYCLVKGNDNYTNKNYDKAFQYFAFSIKINQDPNIEHDTNDAILSYYAGLAAYQAKKYSEAKEYFIKAHQLKYKDEWLFRGWHYACLMEKDTAGAEVAILEGYKVLPDSTSIIVDIVNLYIQTKKYDKALKYLDPAIAKSPNNPQFYLSKAQMYDQMGKWEDAEKNYLESIKLNPEFYDAYFNLGVLYYNWATDYNNQAASLDLKQQDKYNTLIAKRDELYKKALEPLQKASLLKPDDLEVLSNLSKLYGKLKMKKEKDEVNEKIEKLSGK